MNDYFATESDFDDVEGELSLDADAWIEAMLS